MIYVIIRHDFDQVENREPVSTRVEGYMENEEDVVEYVEDFNNSDIYYVCNCKYFRTITEYSKLYSRNKFPYLTYQGINKIILEG